MNKEEIKYCKFCNKEKPLKEFAKSGFAIKNICRECQNKKQKDMYHNNKKVEELQQENKKYKEIIDKAKDKLYCWGEVLDADFQKQMLDILKEVE